MRSITSRETKPSLNFLRSRCSVTHMAVFDDTLIWRVAIRAKQNYKQGLSKHKKHCGLMKQIWSEASALVETNVCMHASDYFSNRFLKSNALLVSLLYYEYLCRCFRIKNYEIYDEIKM